MWLARVRALPSRDAGHPQAGQRIYMHLLPLFSCTSNHHHLPVIICVQQYSTCLFLWDTLIMTLAAIVATPHLCVVITTALPAMMMAQPQ